MTIEVLKRGRGRPAKPQAAPLDVIAEICADLYELRLDEYDRGKLSREKLRRRGECYRPVVAAVLSSAAKRGFSWAD